MTDRLVTMIPQLFGRFTPGFKGCGFVRRYAWNVGTFRFESSINKGMSTDELNSRRLNSIEEMANRDFFHSKKDKENSTQTALQIASACKRFQDSIYQYAKLEPGKNPLIVESNRLIEKVLKSKSINFDVELLRKLLTLQPKYLTSKTIIESYYSLDPKAYVPSDIARIPFRKYVWDADFQRALDYIELTTGNQRYLNYRQSLIKKYLGYFGGTMVGLIGVIHVIVKLFFPDLVHSGTGGTKFGIYGVYAMIVSYFMNCGFLATLAFSSRGMENGSLLFKHGSMPWQWYQKVDQMQMCAKVLEADAAIHGAEGFATREVVSRIKAMGFDVNEPEQEVMMRQYWYSSGEGFVWVEPDLDPAELQWWDHLHEVGVKRFWDKDYDKLGGTAAVDQDISNDDDDGDDDLLLPESK